MSNEEMRKNCQLLCVVALGCVVSWLPAKCVCAESLTASETVGQWERFECVVTNDTSYGDPYRDLELAAIRRTAGGGVLFCSDGRPQQRTTVRAAVLKRKSNALTVR